MTVIDKILNEWSFRCHDGIVDMNDPTKVSILKEILKEYNLDEQEKSYTELSDELKAAMLNLSYDEKSKILSYIKKIKNKEEQTYKIFFKKFVPYLENKGLRRKEASDIFAEFIKEDKEDELIEFFNNLPKLSISDLSSIKLPIYNIFKNQIKCKECITAIDNLYNTFAGSGGTKGIGKEENFLVAFYKNVQKRQSKGDIIIDEVEYEVKGVNSVVSPFSRGDKEDVYPILKKIIELIEENISKEKYAVNEKEIQGIISSNEKWVSSIVNLGNNLFRNDDIKKYLEILEISLREIYKSINLNDVLENGKISDNLVAINIAQYSIDKYEINPKEQFIFVSKNGEIKIVPTKEELKNLINSGSDGINITAFSDRAPRLTYKGINTFATKEIAEKNNKPTEEPISE